MWITVGDIRHDGLVDHYGRPRRVRILPRKRHQQRIGQRRC